MLVFKVQAPFNRLAVTRFCGTGLGEERILYLDYEMVKMPPVQNGEEDLRNL